MSVIVSTYLVYVAGSLGLTAWVARTLFRNGALFLVDVFNGDEQMARAVNHLLVVGFWLVNLGFIAFALQIDDELASTRTAIEELSAKIGGVALVLGAMHFGNLYVLSRIRRGRRLALPWASPVRSTGHAVQGEPWTAQVTPPDGPAPAGA